MMARPWKFAEQVLSKKNAYNWNQALMDLGGMICTAESKMQRMSCQYYLCICISKTFLQKYVSKKRASLHGKVFHEEFIAEKFYDCFISIHLP